jgi:hypothetical protein
MPVIAIASCPNPPLLLPGATGRPVAEVEQLRMACLSAIGVILQTRPDRLALIGGARAEEAKVDALSLRVGRSLLIEAGAELTVSELFVPEDSSSDECRKLGDRVASADDRVALVVMADGSARRTLKAPGYLDERAAPYDRRIEVALAQAYPPGLADLEPALAAELLVAGRAAWQVLAAAAGQQVWQATMHYVAEPFGVFYPVASWLPRLGLT